MRMLLERRSFCRLAVGALTLLHFSPRLWATDESADPLALKIERQAVESSIIASIGFHARWQVLEIEFRSGAIYRYLAVPVAIFEGFQKAESKGRYFSQHIRGRYDFRRLHDPKPRE